MLADGQWWLDFMRVFNGSVHMVEPRPLTTVHIDACGQAAGASFLHDVIHVPFSPEAANLHINYKEVLALEPAC